jgi:hypothetical protein
MYKRLSLAIGIVGIVVVVTYHILDAAGLPKADQRPLRIAFIAVIGLTVALYLSRLFVRRNAPPEPDPQEPGPPL